MSKIKFGVVGCGHIGKRHANMILSNPDFKLVALCDIMPIQELALENFTGTTFFNSFDELIESKIDIDAVAIATPNGCHQEQALKVLENNWHVVIEKPMALTKAGCEQIIFKALQ